MASATEQRERLDEITDLLQSGITETSVDGETNKFDVASLRREKRELEVALGLRRKRRRMVDIQFGGR